MGMCYRPEISSTASPDTSRKRLHYLECLLLPQKAQTSKPLYCRYLSASFYMITFFLAARTSFFLYLIIFFFFVWSQSALSYWLRLFHMNFSSPRLPNCSSHTPSLIPCNSFKDSCQPFCFRWWKLKEKWAHRDLSLSWPVFISI